MYAGNDTLTMVLLTANQFISAFQLSTVLPVMCHISRGQVIYRTLKINFLVNYFDMGREGQTT
jgi:hypothetical protein